jgi:hypothetical protein
LVIFPEGEVLHLNDQTAPFRLGAATAALRGARRSRRPVACIPCALKYQYVDDPTPRLAEVMSRLERRTGLKPAPDMSLVRRIERLVERVLRFKEWEYLGRHEHVSMHERTETLEAEILARLERRYGVSTPRATVPERVKELRRRAILRCEQRPGPATAPATVARRDLDDLFFVMQLFSYPADYLAGRPSIERLAETVDKLEEDILEEPTANLRGRRRVTVTFGEPILAEPTGGPSALEITSGLRRRVQALLDHENGLDEEYGLDEGVLLPPLAPSIPLGNWSAAQPAA